MLAGCCFTSTETVGLLGTGAQDGHLDFHTAPELYREAGENIQVLLLQKQKKAQVFVVHFHGLAGESYVYLPF